MRSSSCSRNIPGWWVGPGRPLLDDPRVRRVYLRRIRYYVYFQLSDDAEAVEIVAVWDGTRGAPPTI
ncbi:MAG: hypothetical protein AB1Z98_28465 [Nannocystaceae bacterium]